MSASPKGTAVSEKLVMGFKTVQVEKTQRAPQTPISPADTASKTARPAAFAPEMTCVFRSPVEASASTDAHQVPIVVPATPAARLATVWVTFAYHD